MNIAEFSIKQRVLVNLIAVAIIIVGTFITLKMKRETFPKVPVDWVTIGAVYPGASPYEVEKLVTIPLEDAIDDIDGIDAVFSGSQESICYLWIELEPNLDNRDKVINEISREVDKVQLPDDVEDPEVNEFVLQDALIEVSFSGKDISEKELRKYVKNFEQILKNIKDVGGVDRYGWRDTEIVVEVDPANLEKYYISLAQVIQSIRNQNLNLPGGKIKSGSKEVILRTVGELETAKEFEEIIIRTNTDGKYLRIGDIARSKEVFEEREVIYKTDGEISINLIPKKKDSGDVIKMVDQIREEAKKYEKILPDNVSINLLNDMAFYVKRRLNVLVSNGSIGLVLLLLTLLVFLNVRIAVVTAIGIPFAFLGALIFMSFFDVSLNLLTMFGLILVLGMIVDDAIVVSENVYRHMENNKPIHEAVVLGVKEVAAPVTATIITTMCAFLPLMFIAGIMGKFLKFFPMGVIFCLAASLIEALIVLPSHLYDWSKPLKSREELGYDSGKKTGLKKITHYFTSHDRKGSEAGWFKKIQGNYLRLLKFSIHNKYKMIASAALVLLISIIFAVKFMPFKLFPDFIETFFVKVEATEGTSLEGTSEIVSHVEEVLLRFPKTEVENFTSIVGMSGMGQRDINNKVGTQYGQSVVYLTPHKDRQRDADSIITQIREEVEKKKLPNIVNLSIEKMQHGPPVGKPIAVEIRGDDYNVMLKIVKKIEEFMKGIDGVEDIKNDYELDKEEVRISIDKKEAARLGLSVMQIASTIRYAFEGGVATTMRRGDEDIDVIVRLPEKFRNDFDSLEELTIPNNMNRLIKLNKVASFSKVQGIKLVGRVDGKRSINITANIDENKTTTVEANRKIINKFGDIPQQYPGYYFKCGGEWEDTTESISSLFRAFGIAFMLIYIVLATQFRSFLTPFVIMTSIPFGIIGVIVALYLHGQPLSLMAMFGMVGLTGVVVNDSLIFVDFINKRKEQGLSLVDAIIDAGKTRLRPILLTSITTIIALMPLIYGIGGEEPFLVPAAISMSYGLLAATFLTLVIVPCVYLISFDFQNLFNKKKQ